MPIPMAPRETFSDSFVHKLKNKNIVNNIDYTVDFEISTTPFEKTKITLPKNIGEEIPSRSNVMVPTNLVKAASDEIFPSDTNKKATPIMSRADIPIVDILGDKTKEMGKNLAVYVKKFGEVFFSYMQDIAKNNNAISQVFKDNSKLISVLIAVAAGSFIMNAGVSAIMVGIVLLIATKNVTKLF